MHSAKCLCGQLEVRVEGEPVNVTACNCSLCQRRGGGPYGLGTYWERNQVIEIKGPHKAYARPSEFGRDVENHFCPECGTNVFWYVELRPELIGIAAGCFESPTFAAPRAVSYSPRKWDWVTFPEGIPHNETISIAPS